MKERRQMGQDASVILEATKDVVYPPLSGSAYGAFPSEAKDLASDGGLEIAENGAAVRVAELSLPEGNLNACSPAVGEADGAATGDGGENAEAGDGAGNAATGDGAENAEAGDGAENGATRDGAENAAIPVGAADNEPAEDIFSVPRPHAGHRERMRERFRKYGREYFDSYELLEMLLFYVIPQRDTNPLAKHMLSAMGGMGGVVSASYEELVAAGGVGRGVANYISRFRALTFENISRVFSIRRVDDVDYHAAAKLAMACLGKTTEPAFCSCFLDNSLKVIKSTVKHGIHLSSAGVRPELVTKGVVDYNAAVVITATSNPYGTLYPSFYDEQTVEMLRQATEEVGAGYAKHFIVSGNEYRGTGRQDPAGYHVSRPEDKKIDLSVKAVSEGTPAADFLADLLASPCFKIDRDLILRQLKLHKTCAGLMNAPWADLKAIFGESGTVLIKLLAAIASRGAQEAAIGKPFPWDGALGGLCCRLLLGLSKENAYALFLDREDRVLGCKWVGAGTVARMELFPRTVLDNATELGALRVVLVHGHPKGEAYASEADMIMTERLSRVLASCNIELSAHIVVADAEHNIIYLSERLEMLEKENRKRKESEAEEGKEE